MIKRISENPFYQWELDRQISIKNVEFDEIHWYNKTMKKALVTVPSSNIVNIPNILLQSAENIYIFVMKDEKVIEHTSFGVCPRKQPEDYVYTETEHFTYTEILKRLDVLESKLAASEVIECRNDDPLETKYEFSGDNTHVIYRNYNETPIYALPSASPTPRFEDEGIRVYKIEIFQNCEMCSDQVTVFDGVTPSIDTYVIPVGFGHYVIELAYIFYADVWVLLSYTSNGCIKFSYKEKIPMELIEGNITTEKIENGAITEEKLDSNLLAKINAIYKTITTEKETIE